MFVSVNSLHELTGFTSSRVTTYCLPVKSNDLLHRFARMLDLALSDLDDRAIDLAGAHGDAGEIYTEGGEP